MESEDESEWREEDSNWWDEDDEHPGEDPEEDLEAMIEQADRPFASLSFGTTAEEQKEGESLDEHLREEQPSKTPLDRELAIEDFDDEEDELVATASIEQLFCISYCVPRLDEREEEGAINKRSAA